METRQLPEDLLQRVKLIELATRRTVDDALSGSFKSSFKGTGVQFAEHRQYVAGDDVRHIDWKVSARTRDPLIKKFDEERELTVFLVVDISSSLGFGSGTKLKSEAVAELAALITHAASRAGDKVGLLLFAGKVEKLIPPRKGRNHLLRMIRELLTERPTTPGTALDEALLSASRLMKHSGVVFLIRDFHARDFSAELKRLSRRHDVVALNVRDLHEEKVPAVGRILVQDPETGQEAWIDTDSYGFRKWLESFEKDDATHRRDAFRGGRVEEVRLEARQDYADALVHYLRARARRRK